MDKEEAYDNVVTGKLKLKTKPLKTKKEKKDKKKKKSKKEKRKNSEDSSRNKKKSKIEEIEKVIEEVKEFIEVDTRTESQKKFDLIKIERQKERIEKLSEKSYKDKLKDYNSFLGTLSEHHDIPKVGPG